MRLINADAIVHYQSYDDEHEDFPEHESTIADFLDAMTDEGCPKPVDAVPMDDVFALAIALSKGIEVLELPARVYNALSRSAYYTVADVYVLWKSGNLKKLWNLGDKSIGEIEDRLCEYLPYLWRTEGRWNGTAEKTEKTV